MSLMLNTRFKCFMQFACLAALTPAAYGFDWTTTSLSWRNGSQFAEPFNPKDIRKDILGFTHANGYQYGTNFLNVDYLMSGNNEPRSFGSSDQAREVYVVYRHTFDVGRIAGTEIRWGAIKGLGVTAGFDFNHKDDAGYNSRKQMFVLGPTLMLDVPGFLKLSLLQLWESNHPGVSAGAFNPGYPSERYAYKPHPMLSAAWAIPIQNSLFAFEGYANFIAPKGRDETNNQTVAETNIDMQLMYDLSSQISAPKNTVRLGLEYQYWKNKFGNSDAKVGARGGNVASTPMVRLEYRF